MLGQKRNASLFAAPEAPLDTVVSVPVPSESIGGTRGELVPARKADSERIEPAFFAKNASASHSLFFTPEDDSRDFPDVCREVQGYIAANYSSLMTGSADSREQIKLPDERHGLLFVFRVFNRMSYALILSAQDPVKRGDRFTQP